MELQLSCMNKLHTKSSKSIKKDSFTVLSNTPSTGLLRTESSKNIQQC
jgi:hypothetical protein